jgi:hypothetical protein
MKKLLTSLSLLVAAGALSTLAGCELYFGDHGGNNNSDTWTYCGSDGQYQCQGDSCEWVSSTCTDPGGGSGGSTMGSGSSGGSGYECTGNTDCAAGCYCSSGTCTEGGFCSTDADCGNGYHCDTQRSSCEPNPQGYCNSDTDCNQAGGQFCDTSNHTCTQGSCAGAITCTTAKPTCASGSSPLIFNGCYTGACFETDQCSAAPVCENINDENDCLNRTADCSATYTGLNCTTSDGTACHSGDSGCTCQSFVFATCATRTPN